MRRSTQFLAFALALSACRPNLPPDKPLAPPIKTKGFFYIFPTGLRLVVYEDPRATEFMLDVSYGIGGRDETPKQSGLAHLCEHMAFKGRQNGPGTPQIWERLLTSGVEFNAETGPDGTHYFEIAKPDQFNSMVALEAGRMRDPLANVVDADFLSEREVVVSEFRQRLETDPDQMQFGMLMESVFNKHPYGAEVAGSVASLRAMKLDDVRAWFKDHYAPENAVIVVTGPKPAAEVIRFVGAAFGKLAKGTPGQAPVPPMPRGIPPFPVDPAEGAPMVVKHAPIEQPVLWMAWTVPGQYSSDFPRGYVVSSILGQILDNRFGEDKRVDDSVCFLVPFDGAGMVACRITVPNESDAASVAETVNDQLSNFVATDRDDFRAIRYATNLVRGQLLTGLYRSVEQIDAAQVAEYLRATGNPDYLGGYQAEINAALDSDIGAYAYKYVNRKRAIAMLVAPEKEILVRVKDEAAPKVGEAFDSAGSTSALNFSPEQIEALASKPGLDKVERKTLANGLKVVVAKRGNIPMVDVRLVVTAPMSASTAETALHRVALDASWRSFNEDSQTHWTKVGAQPTQDFDGEHIVFGGDAPAGNLPHLLADAANWSSSPGSDGAIFDSEARRAKDDQAVHDKRPHDRGLAVLRAGLFPGHPYGKTLTASDFKSLDHGDGDAWLKGVLRPDQATLIIAGEVEPSPELWSQIEGDFGSWKAPAKPAMTALGISFAPARKIVFVNRPHASQSEITLALALPPPRPEQTAAMDAMRWVVGRNLLKSLREQQGVTYGVNPFSRSLAQADILGVTTSVDQSASAHALKTMLDQIQALRDAPLSEQTIQEARWQVARGYSRHFDQVGQASDALVNAAENRWAADYYETFPSVVSKLDAASVQAVARDLRVGDEVVVVVGDKDQVLPQLQKAGFQVEVDPGVASP